MTATTNGASTTPVTYPKRRHLIATKTAVPNSTSGGNKNNCPTFVATTSHHSKKQLPTPAVSPATIRNATFHHRFGRGMFGSGPR